MVVESAFPVAYPDVSETLGLPRNDQNSVSNKIVVYVEELTAPQ